MGEALRLCSLTVCRGGGGGGIESSCADTHVGDGDDAEAAAAWQYCYELVVRQDLDDGLYHEPEEAAATLRFQVGACV